MSSSGDASSSPCKEFFESFKKEQAEEAAAAEQKRAEEAVAENYRRCNEEIRQNGARIVLMGGTGTGKTSLLNAAFRLDPSTGVGHAMPTTMGIKHFEPTDECPVHIYDTKGFEVTSTNEDIIQDLKFLREERRREAAKHPAGSGKAIAERIHAVWWVTHNRLEKALTEKVQEAFGEGVPIFIVVNFCDKDKEVVRAILDQIKSECAWAAAVLPVVAVPEHGPLMKVCERCKSNSISVQDYRKKYTCENRECSHRGRAVPFKNTYGVAELINTTVQLLPELVASSFAMAQRESLAAMDTAASVIVKQSGLMAAGVGLFPIPFSDLCVLLLLQKKMLSRLAGAYNVTMSPSTLGQWPQKILKLAGVEATGRFAGPALKLTGRFAGSALKLIPGIGQVFGMTIDAVIASATTVAIGLLAKENLRRVRGKAQFAEVTMEDFREVIGVEEQTALVRHYYAKATTWLSRAMEEHAAALPSTPPPLSPLFAVKGQTQRVRWSHGPAPGNVQIKIGRKLCAEDSDDEGAWKVPKWKAEPQTVSVTITIDDGEPREYPDAFSYIEAACIREILPERCAAFIDPGALMLIHISGFQTEITQVQIGGADCQILDGGSSSEVMVKIPMSARPGCFDVSVSAGQQAATLKEGFEYYVPSLFGSVGQSIDLSPDRCTVNRKENVNHAVCLGADVLGPCRPGQFFYEFLIQVVRQQGISDASSLRAFAVGFANRTASLEGAMARGSLSVSEATELDDVWLVGYEKRGTLAISKTRSQGSKSSVISGWRAQKEVEVGKRIGVLACQQGTLGPEMVIFVNSLEKARVKMEGVESLERLKLVPVVDLQGRAVEVSLIQQPILPECVDAQSRAFEGLASLLERH